MAAANRAAERRLVLKRHARHKATAILRGMSQPTAPSAAKQAAQPAQPAQPHGDALPAGFMPTCDLGDRHKAASDTRLRVLPPVFHHYGGRTRFAGRVVTVKCFEDNSLVKAALESPGDGRVLVVEFIPTANGVTVRETFDAEETHPVELQRAGWQAILDRFARHVEGR